jgi:hypothetical protein
MLHTSPLSVNAMVKSAPHATAMVCGRDADGLGEVQTRCAKDRLGDAGTFQFQGLLTGCKNHISLLSKKNKNKCI